MILSRRITMPYQHVRQLLLFVMVFLPMLAQAGEPVTVEMYKDPNCGCCGSWAKHLRNEGFTVVEHKRTNMAAIKEKYGITQQLASCHTALVGDYIIEGHVPADDIKRLLREQPAIAGLSAPGMPEHSPGMQPEGLPASGYKVLSFQKDGSSRIYSSY